MYPFLFCFVSVLCDTYAIKIGFKLYIKEYNFA